MGREARARGTFEERKAQAIAEGRIKHNHYQEVLYRKFVVFEYIPSEIPAFPDYPKFQSIIVNGLRIDRTIRMIPIPKFKQPGSRKNHKNMSQHSTANAECECDECQTAKHSFVESVGF